MEISTTPLFRFFQGLRLKSEAARSAKVIKLKQDGKVSKQGAHSETARKAHWPDLIGIR